MQRGWQCTGIAFAILFAAWAQQSWLLSLTDALGPGPGFFPFALSLAGLALSVALVLRPAPARDEQAGSGAEALFPRGRALRSVLIVLAALIGVALLLEPLGFRLTLAAFCLVLLPVLGARNPVIVVLFAFAASFGVNALFSDLLKVPLPEGLLGF
jgi:putative tricarboxylic transport membrane protein